MHPVESKARFYIMACSVILTSQFQLGSAGVAQVQIVRGLERTVNIDVDAERLASLGISITVTRNAIVRQHADIPGGNVTGAGSEQVLRTTGRIQTPEAFNSIIVATVNGTPTQFSSHDHCWREQDEK